MDHSRKGYLSDNNRVNVSIVVSLRQEFNAIVRRFKLKETLNDFDCPVRRGTYQRVNLSIACCGPGKVNASRASEAMINRLTPELVVSAGLAGALSEELRVGDVVIGTNVIYHDTVCMTDAGPKLRDLRAFRKGRLVRVRGLKCDDLLLAASKKVAKAPGLLQRISFGRVATGDQMVVSVVARRHIQKMYDAIAVDMESAAVAQVCFIHKIRFASVRVISDVDGSFGSASRAPSLVTNAPAVVNTSSQTGALVLWKIFASLGSAQ
jgi:adenosylhomocysteine nucleosidase